MGKIAELVNIMQDVELAVTLCISVRFHEVQKCIGPGLDQQEKAHRRNYARRACQHAGVPTADSETKHRRQPPKSSSVAHWRFTGIIGAIGATFRPRHRSINAAIIAAAQRNARIFTTVTAPAHRGHRGDYWPVVAVGTLIVARGVIYPVEHWGCRAFFGGNSWLKSGI